MKTMISIAPEDDPRLRRQAHVEVRQAEDHERRQPAPEPPARRARPPALRLHRRVDEPAVQDEQERRQEDREADVEPADEEADDRRDPARGEDVEAAGRGDELAHLADRDRAERARDQRDQRRQRQRGAGEADADADRERGRGRRGHVGDRLEDDVDQPDRVRIAVLDLPVQPFPLRFRDARFEVRGARRPYRPLGRRVNRARMARGEVPTLEISMASVIEPEALETLVAVLRRRGFRVLGPMVRDGAIVYADLASAAELPIGVEGRPGAGQLPARAPRRRRPLRLRGRAALVEAVPVPAAAAAVGGEPHRERLRGRRPSRRRTGRWR